MGWLLGYTYRKAINIGSATGAGTNYQVKIVVQPGVGSDSPPTVYLNSHSQFFPNDLAFTASDGTTLLKHWYEYDSNNFWVKVADTLESNATIYIYYGNASVLPNPVDAPVSAIWKRYTSNPVLTVGVSGQWDDKWVQIHSIVIDGSTWYAYYTGMKTGVAYQTGLATSSDGITWTKSGSNPVLTIGGAGAWDDGGASGALVWKEGSNWYMLYSGLHSGVYQIGLATSSDGISWTKYGSNPVMSGGVWDSVFLAAGTVMLKEGSTYYLYYGGGTSISNMATWQIGLATSTDLHTWTKSGNNPILAMGSSTWDNGIFEPCVMKFGSTYYMWYQGNQISPDRSRIGLATSAAKDSGWSKSSGNPIVNNAQDAWDDAWTESPIVIQTGNEWRLYFAGSKGSGATIGMSSGYATYTQIGDPANTFLFFEDFNAFTLDAGIWTNTGTFTQDRGGVQKYAANTNTNYRIRSVSAFAYPFAVQTKVKVGSDWSSEYGDSFAVLYDDGTYNAGHWAAHTKSATYDFTGVGKYGGTYNKTDEAISANTYYKLELRLISAASQLCILNGTQKGSTNQTPAWASANIVLHTGRASGTSDYTTYFDWAFVRKIIATEPVIYSFGGEATVPSGSNITSVSSIQGIQSIQF